MQHPEREAVLGSAGIFHAPVCSFSENSHVAFYWNFQEDCFHDLVAWKCRAVLILATFGLSLCVCEHIFTIVLGQKRSDLLLSITCGSDSCPTCGFTNAQVFAVIVGFFNLWNNA